MFPDKDLGCNSKTISNSQKHKQSIAAVRLSDIVGICKLGTLSLTKVADNIVVDVYGKCNEFAHSLMHRSSTAGYVSHPVSGAITPSLLGGSPAQHAIHPYAQRNGVGTFADSIKK